MRGSLRMRYLWAVCLFLSIFLQSVHTFDRVLRRNEKGWTFPKSPAYHYYQSTVDIPDALLPVQVGSIPLGKHGIWILRGDDFPKESKKAIINFSSRRDFNSVTVKALAFGDVQLDLAFHKRSGGTDEKLSFFGKDKEVCEAGLKRGESQDANIGFKWINYSVQNIPGCSQMNVAVALTGSKSFLIIDDISVHFGDHMEDFSLVIDEFIDDESEEKIDTGSNQYTFRVDDALKTMSVLFDKKLLPIRLKYKHFGYDWNIYFVA